MLKKILIGLFLFCLLLGVAAYFGAQALVKNGSDKMLVEMANFTQGKAVELVDPKIDSAKVSFMPVGVAWKGFEAGVRTSEYKEVWGLESLSAQFSEISVNANDSKYEEFSVEIRDGVLLPVKGESNSNGFEFKKLSLQKLALPFRLNPDRPEDSIAALLGSLGELIRKGESKQPIALEGTLEFLANGNAQSFGLFSSQIGDTYLLEIDRKSMAQLVSKLKGEWTEAEIDVAARHPIQAPMIMFLSDYAVAKSKAEAAKDASLPEDAYRHLLWSYTLTKRLGDKLAKEVTDAHEVGATDNTEADHRMDYQNNALGRRYVAEGRSEEDLLSLVKNDPAVVKSP